MIQKFVPKIMELQSKVTLSELDLGDNVNLAGVEVRDASEMFGGGSPLAGFQAFGEMIKAKLRQMEAEQEAAGEEIVQDEKAEAETTDSE